MEKKQEEWKVLKETNDKYSISNHGRVKDTITEKIMSIGKYNKKYPRFACHINGKFVNIVIAKYVVKYFIDPDNHRNITYLDGNIENVYYENLSVKKSKSSGAKDLEWEEIENYPCFWISNYGDIKSRSSILTPVDDNYNYCLNYNKRDLYINALTTMIKQFIDKDFNIHDEIIFLDGNKNNTYYKNIKIIKSKNMWRDLYNLGLYQIDEYGNVDCIDRYGNIICRKVQSLIGGVKIITLNLTANSKTSRSVAKLVATYFVPNPNNYNYVEFIDGDRNNTYYKNLEWVKNTKSRIKNSKRWR